MHFGGDFRWMESSEPPLFSGVIHGIRMWHIVSDSTDEPLLESSGHRHIWPPQEEVRASCLAERAPGIGHVAPAPNCTCGLYAVHPSGQMMAHLRARVFDGLSEDVVGVVEASGRIEVHPAGFRAERARVVNLFISGSESPYKASLLSRLAKRYDAELAQFEDGAELRDFCRRRLNGLTRAMVDQLVASALEVRLEPVFQGVVGPGERTCVWSGYRVDGAEASLILSPGSIRGFRRFEPQGCDEFPDAIQDTSFLPGQSVALIPEPNVDKSFEAVSVWNASRDLQVGWVPAKLARAVADDVGGGAISRAIVLAQLRDLEDGKRCGLRILTCPTTNVRMLEPSEGDECLNEMVW